jgi:hypothetical protein
MRVLGWRIVIALLCIGLAAAGSLPATAGTTGSIQGHVTNEAGIGISGVAVTAASPSGHFTTTSGADGFYTINGLPLDTYTLTFSKEGYQTTSVPGITTVQDQPNRVNAHMSTSVKSLGRVTVRGTMALVQPTVTADTYVVNQQRLSDLNGTPQDLNGFQAFNSLPGVTPDNTGFPTIRAGASNDVGYQLDGVDNTEIGTGEYLNALTLNGAHSVQLSTGGYDVSNGNTNSGVINEVVQRGTYPPKGQMTLRIDNPLFGHEISIDYGGATPNNKFSYYYSFGGFRHGQGYGDLHTTLPLEAGFNTFDSVNDNIINLFYHFGEGNKNEIQFLSNMSGESIFFNNLADPALAPYAPSNGNVQFSSDVFNLCAASISSPFPPCNQSLLESNYITLYPGQQNYTQNINYADTQTFNSYLNKLNFKRQLSPSSFADVRITKTYLNWIDRYPYNVGSFTDHYFNEDVSAYGAAFDYTNQLSSKNEISLGGEGIFYNTNFYLGNPSLQPTYEPLLATGCAAAAAALFTPTQQAGGCYIAPFNAALNTALGLGLPTDPGHAPLNTYVQSYGHASDPLHRWDLFVRNRWQPNERLTVSVGLRWDKESIAIPPNAAQLNSTYFIDPTTPSGCGVAPAPPCNIVTIPGQSIGTDVTQPQQVSPRIAASYELTPRDAIRFSYGKNIEFIPLSGLENTYQLPSSLQNCNIASGCFVPLPGYPVTNQVTNLLQQVTLDLTTKQFAQYTPVLPQTAVNADFSFEHEFGDGIQLRLTPYYRKGTNYVVGSAPLLFTLRGGTPVFGPSREQNAGINENTGVEFALERNAPFGLSGFAEATYDNTWANYDGDFFPTVNNAAIAANHYFHVTYVAPISGTFNLVYNSQQGFHVSTTVYYESGYRYGVGKKTFVFDNNGNPIQVLNTDLASGSKTTAYYVTNPNNQGTVTAPNIVASRGTPEGDDPGSLFGPPITTVNFTVSHDLGKVFRGAEAGIRLENAFGNYNPSIIPVNPYFAFNGFGNFGLPSGVNNNQCFSPRQSYGCEPFQYNYSTAPYEKEQTGTPRLYTFYVSVKY